MTLYREAELNDVTSQYEKTPVMLHSIDREGRLVSVSDRWLEVLGYERHEVLGRRSVDFLTEASRSYAESEILPSFFATGSCRNVPYQFVRKNGEVVDVLLSAAAVRDDVGHIVRSLAVSIEVTELNRARERLRAVEARYESLVENVPAVVYTTALDDGQPHYVSPQIERLLGYTQQEWVNADLWAEVLHPDDRERITASIAGLSACGDSLSMEYRMRSRQGRWVWVRDDRIVVREPGALPSVQGFMKDVTDRRVAEQAQRASEERYRRIVDTAQEGIWTLDAEARTTFVNRRMADMLKYAPQEMLGRPLFDFMDAVEAATAQRLFERRRKGIAEKHDFLFRCKDETRVWTMVSTAPMFDDKLQFVGALAMITDITERKRSEMSLAISEAMYRGIVEDQTELICRFTPQGDLTFVNGAFCRYFGKRDPAALEGTRLLSLFSRENRGRLNEQLTTLGWKERVSTVELEIKQRGGVSSWLGWTSRAIFDKDGRLSEFQSIGRDLTDLKGLELLVKGIDLRYRALLAAERDPVFVYEVTTDRLPGPFIDVNPAACHCLHYDRGELLKLRFLDLLPREQLDAAFAHWQDLLRERHIEIAQVHVTKHGERIAVAVDARLLEVNGKLMVLSIARPASAKLGERARTEPR
ncbi:MAG: PAS domain S-box protein [Planctomycetota bacterium]